MKLVTGLFFLHLCSETLSILEHIDSDLTMNMELIH